MKKANTILKSSAILLLGTGLLFGGCAKISDTETSSDNSTTSSENSSTTTLSAPTGLTATGGNQQVVLDWTAVSGASSYTVYWDNASGITTSDSGITSITTDNYTHTGRDNSTTYYYKVAAINSAGTGTLSSEVSAATFALLSAPDNVSASGASGTVTLDWNAVSGASSYTVYWDNVSGISSSDTAITSISTDNYTHSSLSDGTYYYKVAAVNDNGTGALSAEFSSLLASNIQGSATNNGHTYAITSSAMNWENAKIEAASLGGYLATINTKAENDWLTAKFISYGNIWIGNHDKDTEGTWVWDNGTTSNDGGVSDNISSGAKWPDGTAKWGSGEPNNSGSSEHCGTIRDSSGAWNDVECNSSLSSSAYHINYGIIEFNQ
ncbi:MAG: hypothetical protein H8E38_06520 [SAR324 cluster bacterium]|nr:hypothetical protein [SAR324 cluster bacterium]